MSESGEEALEASVDDCEEHVKKWVLYGVLGWMFLVSFPICLHFFFVLYSYWRDAADAEEKNGGGEEEEAGGEPHSASPSQPLFASP